MPAQPSRALGEAGSVSKQRHEVYVLAYLIVQICCVPKLIGVMYKKYMVYNISHFKKILVASELLMSSSVRN